MNFSIRGTVKTQEEEEQCSCRSVERHQKILFNNSEGGYELFCWREKEKRKWEGGSNLHFSKPCRWSLTQE